MNNGGVMDWPYKTNYEKENVANFDVLVLGGGIAGCWAAISAARAGANVAIVEKGATVRSGAGGSGCDHWLNTPNPCSKVTAEDCTQWMIKSSAGYCNGLSQYIAAKESYDTLLEMEQMGGKIRDTDDEFAGAAFRDEETKFLFAYDYENKFQFRVWGANFKPLLYKECKKLGVKIFDRIMATSLLTEGGKSGKRVIGCTGLDVRTGEFYIFKANAVVMCMAGSGRGWAFSSELTAFSPFGLVEGNGPAIAWRAGATFVGMEFTRRSSMSIPGAPFPGFGTGNPFNTWSPCNIVDANGKEVPWVDAFGRPVKTVSDRARPSEGQKFLAERATDKKYQRPHIIYDLEERIKNGEYALPFYADLPSMPDEERRAIWGLMIGNEASTAIPVFQAYSESGFDPSKDMLQSYIILGGSGAGGEMFEPSLPHIRTGDVGGLVVDWDLMTTLEGLFATGNAVFAGKYHHHAAATGRYVGAKAAKYAKQRSDVQVTKKQVDAEKIRVYAPVKRSGGLEWKELHAGMARVMQNYCGELKSEELLKIGLMWLDDLERTEACRLYAFNPHQLRRVLGVMDTLTCDQMVIHASMARRASIASQGRLSSGFIRLDYPELNPPQWHNWVSIKQEDGTVISDRLALDYWGSLPDNYEAYNRK